MESFEPKGPNMKRLFNQAVGSVKFLADQRDLHQIALLYWITGKFTLADSITDGELRRELWAYVRPAGGMDPGRHDIVIEIVRDVQNADNVTMRARWADDIIRDAAACVGRSTAAADTLTRWGGIILSYRDRRDRVLV